MSTIKIKGAVAGGFTIVPNEFARAKCSDAPPRAAKVYLYLFSHSEGWETSADRIATQIGMGRSTVQAALTDLEKMGHLVRIQTRDEGGAFKGREYHLFQTAMTAEERDQYVSEQENTVGRFSSSGATCEDDAKPQVGTEGRFTADGKPSPFKKNNSKKINKEDSPHSPPKGTAAQPSAGDGAGQQTLSLVPDLADAEVATAPAPEPGKGKRPDNYTAEFLDWYQRYPRKIDKDPAFTAWWKAARVISPADLNALTDRFNEWCQHTGQDKRYIKYPATWLNNRSWANFTDEAMADRAAETQPQPQQGRPVKETARQRYERLRNAINGTPEAETGPDYATGHEVIDAGAAAPARQDTHQGVTWEQFGL